MKTAKQALIEANEKVAQRTVYGWHVDTITARGYRFVWSNNQGRWLAFGRPDPKGTYRMDANYIIIGGISKKVADEIASMMNSLPLYGNSFEKVYLRG